MATTKGLSRAAVCLVAVLLQATNAVAAELKVLKLGVGSGRVFSAAATPGIDCGTDCDEPYGSISVTLNAATTDAESTFAGWSGACSGMGACVVDMTVARLVRATFTAPMPLVTDFTPDGVGVMAGSGGIKKFLADNPTVNSPARFIASLPSEFRQNWILMSRSESLQTGTARSPRILLPSADAQLVFTIGMTEHSSYPGAHPNAIEYMQWDPAQKNFRFHEIIVARVPDMGDTITLPGGMTRPRFPERLRGISIDDTKCSKCHSTRNVLNLDRSVTPPVPGPNPATDGVPAGTVPAKNKPNWDAYDSWGGMLPFNRDRIYQGTLEATAFKHILNLWNWRGSADGVRQILEQLQLQPSYVVATGPHGIVRNLDAAADDQHIRFGFDTLTPLATTPNTAGYDFDGTTSAASSIDQGGRYVTLRTSNPAPVPGTSNDSYGSPVSDEGRGVQLFDLLGGLDGSLNAQRIVDELINHRFATGSVPIDVRPIAMAISKGNCLMIDTATNSVVSAPRMPPAPPLPVLAADLAFFDSRNGMNIVQVRADTMTRWSATTPATRSTNMPRRKADIQKINFDRTDDFYLFGAENGLIQQYGGTTAGDTTVERLRREIFRRPIEPLVGVGDSTMMQGKYIDREDYAYNTDRVALYRYFLEPLGVSVDKWSMGVRGRSRTYTFADVFSTYANVFEPALRTSLLTPPRTIPGLTNPDDCGQLITAINSTLSAAALPDAAGMGAIPTFTDIQRIFNKSCIECHGGLGYPPYGPGYLDFSEDEEPPATTPPMVSPRLARSYSLALGATTTSAATSLLYLKITDSSEACSSMAIGMMPCGGPRLSNVDIETIRRWIEPPSTRPGTAGDPHLKTVDGTYYDFQSAGEFVLLRDEFMEVQARQTAIPTDAPLGPNAHTGLSSCVSLNSAAAVRIGPHRITYQPNVNGEPDPAGLQLRIDGKLARMSAGGIVLPSGGRVLQTTAPGGIQIEAPGGTVVLITPAWWDHYRVWYMNIDVANPRATRGVMGVIPSGNWLPLLPDGTSLGSRPRDLHQRYLDLYERFENAWRVTAATSLFDYAPGKSTASFSVPAWPAENPQSCPAPPQAGGPAARPPLQPLTATAAEQHCAAIVDAGRKANCVQDVMVTGEPGFARTYLLSEQLARNAPPKPPVLGFPENNAAGLTLPVRFEWNRASDADDDDVEYRHCVWIATERPSFANCDATPIRTSRMPFWILLIVVVLLALWILTGARHRNFWLLALLAIAIAGAVTVYVRGAGSQSLDKRVELEAGKAYLWKVIAEDGKGGTTESETRRFTTRAP